LHRRHYQAGDVHPSSGYSNGFAAGTLASLARTLLIEAAHSDAVPDAVREIAWKAQTRLCQRYRHMVARGKLNQSAQLGATFAEPPLEANP
jgi:hypothetical protein